MGRVGSIAVLALLVSACTPTRQERITEYNELGIQRFQKGDYERAREDFQAALTLLPNNFALLFNVAQCYDHLGQTDKAEPLYRQCLQQEPNHVECRHALDALLVKGGRTVEAQRLVQDWLVQQPKLSAAYAEDGWLYEQEGNPTHAIGRYQQALAFDPRNTQALIGMGRIYEEELNYPDRALKLYQTALDYEPHQAELARRVKQLRARGIGSPHPES